MVFHLSTPSGDKEKIQRTKTATSWSLSSSIYFVAETVLPLTLNTGDMKGFIDYSNLKMRIVDLNPTTMISLRIYKSSELRS